MGDTALKPGACQVVHAQEVLTGALVENVEEGSVRHVVGDDDGVRGWRCLTGPKNRQDVRMREDPVRKTSETDGEKHK